MELDLHRLELRFAHLRIVAAPAVQRLANSIEEHGQLVILTVCDVRKVPGV